MTIATRLKDFIDRKGISYDTVAHHRTSTSRQSAIAAHIPGSIVAKSVVVHHELGYALAVVPSTHRIKLGTLQDVMDKRLGLASEDEVTVIAVAEASRVVERRPVEARPQEAATRRCDI